MEGVGHLREAPVVETVLQRDRYSLAPFRWMHFFHGFGFTFRQRRKESFFQVHPVQFRERPPPPWQYGGFHSILTHTRVSFLHIEVPVALHVGISYERRPMVP